MAMEINQPTIDRAERDIKSGHHADVPHMEPEDKNPLDHMAEIDGEVKYPIYQDGKVNIGSLYHTEAIGTSKNHAMVAAHARRLIDLHKRCSGIYMTRAQVIQSPAAQFTRATPADGLPKTYKGRPVSYWDKEIMPVGAMYDAKGQKHVVTAERIDRTMKTFAAARAKGIEVGLPEKHDGTGKNYGFVAALKKNDAGTLVATTGIFEDLADEATRKNASLCLLPKAIGSDGTEYEDFLDHVAINPMVQFSGLADFTPALAATRCSIAGAEFFTSQAPNEDDMKISEKALQCARRLSGKSDLPESEAVDVLADLAEKSAAKVIEMTRSSAVQPPDPQTFYWAAQAVAARQVDAIRAGVTPATLKRLANSLVGCDLDYGKIQMTRATDIADATRLQNMAKLVDALAALAAEGNAGFKLATDRRVIAMDRTVPNDSPDAGEQPKAISYELFSKSMAEQSMPSDRGAYAKYLASKGVAA